MSSWVCPYCQQVATLISDNVDIEAHVFRWKGETYLSLHTEIIRCPNEICNEYTLLAILFPAKWESGNRVVDRSKDFLGYWKLKPSSSAKPLPDYVPAVIQSDYNEACAIVDLSPKASATLSRRCLQGMIRDFHSVVEKTLYKEIQGIKDKVDTTTWDAIDAVRSIGNIGAHMEQDINVIVDVDQNEAAVLIGLIETLIEEWYVHRHVRAERMSKIVAVAAAKRAEKAQE
jgi:Domain of unknown function (DUF4145)